MCLSIKWVSVFPPIEKLAYQKTSAKEESDLFGVWAEQPVSVGVTFLNNNNTFLEAANNLPNISNIEDVLSIEG